MISQYKLVRREFLGASPLQLKSLESLQYGNWMDRDFTMILFIMRQEFMT